MAVRIRELILENFKSYEGRVHVGPFRKFTCVVGPNGAGKSNLVDAISFVLGVATRHLRGDRLQDLVHRKEGESAELVARVASVELVYERGDPTEEGVSVVTFRRIVQPGGESRFLVNGQIITQAEYLTELQSINILSKARNFLVFQGDVEAAARRQGRELTQLFEQVSGSGALKEEYDRLAAEKARKEDNARYLYQKKRNAFDEKKQMALQRDEAAKYQALEADRKQCQIEFYLFRLNCIRSQAGEKKRMMSEEQSERASAAAAYNAKLAKSQEADRQRAQAHLAITSAEKKVQAKIAMVEKSDPQAEATTRLEVLRQRLEELNAGSERTRRRRQQLEEQARKLREERGKAKLELESLKEEKSKWKVQFTPQQQREFEEAQQASEQMTADSGAQVKEVEAKIRAAATERSRVERDVRELIVRRDHLRKRVDDLADAEAKADATLQRDGALAQQRMQQLQKLRLAGKEQGAERGKLHAEREGLLKLLQDSAASERQIERQRQLAKVSQDLKQLFPGVHGLVLDLCKPAETRFRVAVNVALGGYLDSVIADTADGSRQCIRYLKERMLQPLTFLPLDNLRVLPPDRRVMDIVGGSPKLRPALSCVVPTNPQHSRAFNFMLADVVVADDLDVGRHFFFNQLQPHGLSCRVVTLSGETITRDGNLEVNADASRENATRFHTQTLIKNRSKLEAIDQRLYELHSLSCAGGADEVTLQEDARRIEAKASAARQSLDQNKQELAARRQEAEVAEEEVKALEPAALHHASNEARMRAEQRKLEESIGQVVFGHFEHLSKAMGVDNIRRVELDARRKREEAKAAERRLEQQTNGAEVELAMVEQTLRERALQDPSVEIGECEDEVARLREQGREGAQAAASTREELEKLRAAEAELREAEREKEREAAQLAQEVRQEKEQLAEVDRRSSACATELQQLQDRRLDFLRQIVLEDVDVPLVGSGDREALQELVASMSRGQWEAGNAGDAAAGGAAAVDDIADTVDLSRLSAAKRAATSGPVATMIEDEYREKLDRLARELEQICPNMKAMGQLSDAVQQADGAERSAAEARSDIEDVERRFESVRQARTKQFTACFKIVREEIDAVYRQLTRDIAGIGIEGGSAYLDLEDTDDPFNGGVKFTAMPPTKRFSDVSLLSGGERTLAAMALLFAFQAFQRPPFLVLDEVDAHLDMVNLQALARYVAESECQTIVVSLKDKFYSCSQGLVGVTKNRSTDASVVLTVDLDRFRHAQQQPQALQQAQPSQSQ